MVLFVLLYFVIHITVAYYVSPNAVSWYRAQEFCNTQCNSNLASIHEETSYNEMKSLLDNHQIAFLNTLETWIGLKNTDKVWKWSDHTSLNFGANISDSNTPWIANYYNTSNTTTNDIYCTYLTNSTMDYKWNTDNCYNRKQFVCNDCDNNWNKLQKYIVVSTDYNWSDAQNFCVDKFQTDLASIHNDIDLQSIQYLCNITWTDNEWPTDCFIGLNEYNGEDIYEWIDGTTFDFGTDLSGGIYPWATWDFIWGQPDNHGDGEPVVSLTGNKLQYLLNDDSDSGLEYFLCNAPSQLCYAQNWAIFNGNWSWNKCNVVNYGYDESTIILHDIQEHKWSNIMIEYMFGIKSSKSEHDDINTVGIIFKLNETNDFYVGIELTSNETAEIFFDLEDVSLVYAILDNINYIDLFGYFYSFKIELNQNGELYVYFNNKLYFDLDLTDSSNISDIINISNSYYIEYIGLQNVGISTVSKYLYMNGKSFIGPTNEPTISPTTGIPTISPSTPSPILYVGPIITTIPTTTNKEKEITEEPTIIPTAIKPTINPTTTSKINADVIIHDDGAYLSLEIIIMLIVICILLIVCIILLYLRRYNKMKKDFTHILSIVAKNSKVEIDTNPSKIITTTDVITITTKNSELQDGEETTEGINNTENDEKIIKKYAKIEMIKLDDNDNNNNNNNDDDEGSDDDDDDVINDFNKSLQSTTKNKTNLKHHDTEDLYNAIDDNHNIETPQYRTDNGEDV